MTGGTGLPGLLSGKAIFITGAGRGIGADAARIFAAEGAEVLLMSRTESELAAVTGQIRAAGGRAEYLVGSVEDGAALDAAMEAMTEHFGRIDGAFNNAGSTVPPTPVVDLSEENFDAMWSANYRAVWLAMRAEIRAIRATAGTGSIVNNSSVGSFYGNAGRGAYSAAKRAVNSLTATAAVEHGPEGIRINAIAPGMTLTPMVRSFAEGNPEMITRMAEQTPLGRGAEPREVVEAATWLLSDRASYVTGVVLRVDGGLRA